MLLEYKINCEDFIENGLDGKDSMEAIKLIACAGFDAVELSGVFITGGKSTPSRPRINSQDKEAYFQTYAREIKKEISIPLILVGGMRSLEVAEQIVHEGTAEYISMSRPFIREPALIKRWKFGDRQKEKCKSDNLCFQPGFQGKGVYCVTEEREAQKRNGG